MPEDAQPAEGQGAEGGDAGGLYADHLNSVPEEHRELVEGALKGFADKTVSPKLREHADYRKQWEPFEKLGVNEYDPEGLGQLLEFAQSTLADPDALQEWVLETARENGWIEEDPESEGESDPVQDKIQELESQLSQFTERDAAREQQQQEAKTLEYIDGEFNRMKEELGELPSKKAMDWVEARAIVLADSDDAEVKGKAIELAHREYFDMIAEFEKDLLKRKGDQPRAPEQGGRPGTSEEENTDWKTARQRAEARVRGTP